MGTVRNFVSIRFRFRIPKERRVNGKFDFNGPLEWIKAGVKIDGKEGGITTHQL